MNAANIHTSNQPVSRHFRELRVGGQNLVLAVLALVSSFFVSIAVGADVKLSVTAPLRVGVSPTFPPMVFKQNKELVGVEVDLARALGEKLGREVVFVELDWEDQTEALLAGKIDIIMSSMSITPARAAVMSFTRPYLKIGQMALVRREDRNKHLIGLMVPPGTKVGVIHATTGDFLVQREYPKAKRKTYSTGEDAARALMKSKVDMVITDSTLVWYLAGIHASDGLTAAPVILNEEVFAWGVRRGDDALLAAANQFIERASQEGFLLKTFKRWTAVE